MKYRLYGLRLLCTVLSLLSWERGLKYEDRYEAEESEGVAPLVGAWIEIIISKAMKKADEGRSSRGSVD